MRNDTGDQEVGQARVRRQPGQVLPDDDAAQARLLARSVPQVPELLLAAHREARGASNIPAIRRPVIALDLKIFVISC